jgi:hypothetical protein
VSGAFGDFHAEVESVQALGPQHVTAKLRMSGVTTGVEVTQTMWQAAVVRGGSGLCASRPGGRSELLVHGLSRNGGYSSVTSTNA